MDETALIHRAVHGDAAALDAIAVAHRARVYRTALHLLGDPDTADDVTQDVFVRLQASLPGFRGESGLGTWLYRVAVNLSLDRLRARRRRTHDLRITPETHHPTLSVDSTEGEFDRARLSADLRAAIHRLPADQQQVIALRFFDGRSYAEIARLTNLPTGTVASRVFRALARLGADPQLNEELLP